MSESGVHDPVLAGILQRRRQRRRARAWFLAGALAVVVAARLLALNLGLEDARLVDGVAALVPALSLGLLVAWSARRNRERARPLLATLLTFVFLFLLLRVGSL